MTSEHFDQLLTALGEREKFHPFTVELVGGHQFEVDHPLAMVVRRQGSWLDVLGSGVEWLSATRSPAVYRDRLRREEPDMGSLQVGARALRAE